MSITTYICEEALICPVCMYKRFKPNPSVSVPDAFTDVNGIPDGARDRKGNLIHLISSANGEHCSDCGKPLEE